MGADIAIDPRERSPYEAFTELNNRRANLIYECVGLPGMLPQMIAGAPFGGRIVMGGYCMESESFYVFAAQNKGLSVHFATGEHPEDMEAALNAIADGKIDIRPWLSKSIGLNAVAEAVTTMSGPSAPIRSLVDPRKL